MSYFTRDTVTTHHPSNAIADNQAAQRTSATVVAPEYNRQATNTPAQLISIKQSTGQSQKAPFQLQLATQAQHGQQEKQQPQRPWSSLKKPAQLVSNGKPGVIQRMVGFEFETGWDIKKPSNVSWNTKSALAAGHGWRMSPDEIAGNKAKIEFVTVPYEVDGDDPKGLAANIKASFDDMKAYGQKLVALEDTQKIPEALKNYKDVEVTPGGDNLAAKPQVTGGVRQDLLLDFLVDAANKADKKKNMLMPGNSRKDAMIATGNIAAKGIDKNSQSARSYAGTVTLLAYYVRRAYQKHDAAMAKVRAWSKAYIKQIADEQDATVKQQLRDNLLDEKMNKMKEYAPSYAKGNASILPRVRFSKLPGIQSPTLIKDVVAAAGLQEWQKGQQAWPSGMKSLKDDWGTFDESIEKWLTNIQAEDPEGPLVDADFWSASEYEAGKVGMGDQRDDGLLFELRALPSGVTYDQYYEFTKPFLTYFRILNAKKKVAKP